MTSPKENTPIDKNCTGVSKVRGFIAFIIVVTVLIAIVSFKNTAIDKCSDDYIPYAKELIICPD